MAAPQDKKAQDLYVLTPEVLYGLPQGRKITITWTMPGYSRTLPFSGTTLRGALIIFSRFARQKLMTDEPFTSTLLIKDSMPGAAKRENKKMGFMTAWQAYKMAIVLDIPNLQTQLEKRLKAICSDQAKFNDDVAESIAKALREDRLRERTEISMFRSQSLEFNEAVTKFIDPLVAARNKKWVWDEKDQLLAELKEHKTKEQKITWKEAKKEVLPAVGTAWTIVEEKEPEEDCVVVHGG